MALVFRKNQATLSGPEKQQFVQAVLALKAEIKPGNTNSYDVYVKEHQDFVGYGHKGPAFLPWHREYLRRFELDLRRMGWGLGLPYWNWSVDHASPSWPFTADFLGGNGTGPNGKVMDGRFAYDYPESHPSSPPPTRWTLNVFPNDDPSDRYPYLRREFGADPDYQSLPTVADVTATLAATPYDSAPWNEMSLSGFRNKLEGFRWDTQNPPQRLPSQMHGRIHGYIGGSMGPHTSPNDPVFWLHHCYIDKLWADWQVFQLQLGDNSLYLPDGGARTGHNLKDRMPPWDEFTTPAQVLYHHGQLGYQYDTDCDLQPFDEFRPGEAITSVGAGYRLGLENGNLVLRTTPMETLIWESGTSGRPVGFCRMEGYGNLVVYGPDGKQIIWQSHTDGHAAGSRLVCRKEGKVAIYEPNGQQIWSRPPPSAG